MPVSSCSPNGRTSRASSRADAALLPVPGEELIFSILVNGYKVDDGRAMEAVDAFANAVVRGRESR